MNNSIANQQELQFGLPCLTCVPRSNSESSAREKYRKKRDAIIGQYPSELANLLDSDFDRSYLQASKLCSSNGSSILFAGHYALDRLERADASLRDAKVNVAFRPSRIKAEARTLAQGCREVIFSGTDKTKVLDELCSLAIKKGIAPPRPIGPTMSFDGCIRRFMSPVWWERALRKAYTRKAETSLREASLVSRVTGIYASNDAVNRRIESKKRMREFLRSMVAVNDMGEFFTLDQLAAVNVSNPKVRRAELMARLAGLESDCQSRGLVGDLYTLTTPSRYHCTLAKGRRNPRFDGNDPKAGQRWLLDNWARIRAKLGRDEISVCGIRVAEPHHDGTPHWHLLLFCAPTDQHQVRSIIKSYMLKDSGDEPGASARRVSIMPVDYARGSGTSYLAKYVSKNIDGFGINRDYEAQKSVSASDAAVRVETWASLWGIRQFQFFGAPPVGVWREIRRLRTKTAECLEPIRLLVDKGDWAGFTCAFIRTAKFAKSVAIRLWRIWVDQPGEYGDPVGFKTIGVRLDTEHIMTRCRTWTILPVAALEFCQ